MHALKRKRSRLACKPCRDRKRKCDGGSPCITCSEWGYDCYYETRRRKSQAQRPPSVEQHTPRSRSQHDGEGQEQSSTDRDRHGLVQRLEANSGAAFVRKVGLKMDSAKAPKLNLFAWNTGARQLSSPLATVASLSIIEITSLDHIRALARVYFDKVDPCYGFMDRDLFYERLETRWHSPQLSDLYDSVICGVAALGCLFSQAQTTITEVQVVQTARSTLDVHNLTGPPSIDLLTGWALRTIYLRMTDTPHTTWMASCTLMHLVEASGLHPKSHSVLPTSVPGDPELQRRLVGIAHHLNVWTSFDLGLSRVSFQDSDLPAPPEPKPGGDYTHEVLGLLPVSVSLDPSKSKDGIDLTTTLSEVLARAHTQPPSVMTQANATLCLMRRIHAQNIDITPAMADQILDLFKQALNCSRIMVSDCSPWHHAANVPFQIICVLLVMDTRSSLAMLPEAMQTLSLIASTYDTETMREACSAAGLLVMLHQQRRKDDIAVFGEALVFHQPYSLAEAQQQPQFIPSAEEYSWLGALVSDLPALQRGDLDQFLNGDILVDGSL